MKITTLNTTTPTEQPFCKKETLSHSDRIVKIAIASLKELALSLALATITLPFVASAAHASLLLASAIAVVALNTLVRAAASYFKSPFKECGFQKANVLFKYLPPLVLSCLDNTTRDLVVHEGGHALAATLLYKKASPQVEISPFKSGITWYVKYPMSRIGELIGKRFSGMIVSAAGPMACIFTSTALLAISHRIEKIHPQISRYLEVSAIVSIASHVLYALSALLRSFHSKSHDFVALHAAGIHPLASCAIMLACPLIVHIWHYYFKAPAETG